MQKEKKLHLEKFVERVENKHDNKGLKAVCVYVRVYISKRGILRLQQIAAFTHCHAHAFHLLQHGTDKPRRFLTKKIRSI